MIQNDIKIKKEGRYEGLRPSGDAERVGIEKVSAFQHSYLIPHAFGKFNKESIK